MRNVVLHLYLLATVTVFVLSTSSAYLQSQPLFALDEYDQPLCHFSVVGQHIHLEPSKPLLIFTPPFGLQTVVEQWPEDSEHTALILLSASTFQASDETHQTLLHILLRQRHVLALHTNLSEHTDTTISLLWSELAVFETFTGLLLPFYSVVVDPVMTNNNNNNNNSMTTVPLFQIVFPSNSSKLTMMLWNQEALDFARRYRHEPMASASVLDFLKHSQLICLLSRLDCQLAAPSDTLFGLCLSAARRLPRDLATTSAVVNFIPLLTYDGPVTTSVNAYSFDVKRKSVANTVTLAIRQVPERYIRASLFHPFSPSAMSYVPMHFLPCVIRMRFWCRTLAGLFFCIAAYDCLVNNCLRRRFLTKAYTTISNLNPKPYLSKPFFNRAKLI